MLLKAKAVDSENIEGSFFETVSYHLVCSLVQKREYFRSNFFILVNLCFCSSTDLDARPWDFQGEENALRTCVDRFNSRRYGIENCDHLGENGEEDEYQPVDNDVLSVLGEKIELSSEFKNNYERWLDREVFSVSIDWDQLCTCETQCAE